MSDTEKAIAVPECLREVTLNAWRRNLAAEHQELELTRRHPEIWPGGAERAAVRIAAITEAIATLETVP